MRKMMRRRGEKMGNTLVIWVMGVLLFCGGLAQAASKTFYSDGTITDGETWTNVYIYDPPTPPPNHSTVTMTGGVIIDAGVMVHDAATFNFSGGDLDWITAYNQSTVNITDGLSSVNVVQNATGNISGNANVSGANIEDSGILNVYSGSIGQLYGSGSSVVNVYGGYVNTLYGGGPSGVFNLRGGSIASLGTGAIVNVFGYNLAKTDTGGLYGYGQVTGFWQNDLPFTIDLYDSYVYPYVNLIPEPTTFLLLGAGIFLLRKSKRGIQKS